MSKIGKVLEIYICKEKGQARKSIGEGLFRRDYGLVGDAYSVNKNRQVCLIGIEGKEKLEQVKNDGLCIRRFKETITTQGIELYKLEVGTRIRIGESLMEISKVGKSCFPECPIIKTGKKCSLSNEVVFMNVTKEGIIKKGDNIRIS
ncbi:MOSC domain-containing protein [Clostridium sporogenes]|uniref:MOSC domain-containing protein n=1 Tax=Clostridium TaxID=1485 RepID=UPI0022E8AD9B|nr:MOSC domain-containing protein [Clostridium cochlearium]